jgi:hypothetical protein
MFPKISNNKNFENKKSTLILFATLNFSCCLFNILAEHVNKLGATNGKNGALMTYLQKYCNSATVLDFATHLVVRYCTQNNDAVIAEVKKLFPVEDKDITFLNQRRPIMYCKSMRNIANSNWQLAYMDSSSSKTYSVAQLLMRHSFSSLNPTVFPKGV